MVNLLRSRNNPLPCDKVLHIFYQTCKAVQHMHRQRPPIIHRDLKVTVFIKFLLVLLQLRKWYILIIIIIVSKIHSLCVDLSYNYSNK